MFWLTFVVHLFVGATLAGIGVIVALVIGMTDLAGVVGGAAVGYAISVPVAWLIARAILAQRRPHQTN